ncbi:MAG: hypothetical protein AAF944_25345 [Bacteroidota bacterium]
MKNQTRIEELLAESLRQQDRQSEILEGHGKLLEKLVESDERQNTLLEKLVEGQVLLTGQISNLQIEIKSLRGDMNKLFDYLQTKHDKLEERIKRIEDRVFLG